MKKTGQGRIVAVSSLAHKWTKDLDLDNLNSEKKWDPKLLYARTKLANILFINELARRLKEAKLDGILANSVNPGGVKTAIFRHARKAFKYMIMVSQFFFKVKKVSMSYYLVFHLVLFSCIFLVYSLDSL